MSERDPASVDDSGEANEPLYWYKPALIGSPWVFRLKPDGLAWETGGRSGLIRYQRVRRVRLSFRPLTMQSYRFITEIWSDDAPKLQFASTTWRSLTDQGRQDADYREFVTELHRRLGAANTTAQFVAGIHLQARDLHPLPDGLFKIYVDMCYNILGNRTNENRLIETVFINVCLACDHPEIRRKAM